jgi:mitochondrial fission process protein 1
MLTCYVSASESTDSNVRYAAYANRIRTILLSAHRYVAYTSDIGESFRPIAHPILVRGAYAISWSYLIGDVGYEGYKAYLRQQALLHPAQHPGEIAKRAVNVSTGGEGPVYGHVPAIEDYRAVMAQRAVFQSLASMGLPAFTIHSIVRYSGRALKNTKNVTLRTWGPIGVSAATRTFGNSLTILSL